MSLLDRLIVELQLDPKKFSGPAKKAVEDLRTFEKQAGNTGNSVESVGRKGADAFAGVRREALAMFAVFTAGTIESQRQDLVRLERPRGQAGRTRKGVSCVDRGVADAECYVARGSRWSECLRAQTGRIGGGN